MKTLCDGLMSPLSYQNKKLHQTVMELAEKRDYAIFTGRAALEAYGILESVGPPKDVNVVLCGGYDYLEDFYKVCSNHERDSNGRIISAEYSGVKVVVNNFTAREPYLSTYIEDGVRKVAVKVALPDNVVYNKVLQLAMLQEDFARDEHPIIKSCNKMGTDLSVKLSEEAENRVLWLSMFYSERRRILKELQNGGRPYADPRKGQL